MFLPDDIYETILEHNEWWFSYADGCAMLITDVPVMEC